MNDVDVLIPELQEIKVGVRTYLLGELAICQSIKVVKFITGVIIRKTEEWNKLSELFKTSKDNLQDALEIVALISEEEIPQFFGIILKEKDIKYLEENLNTTTATEIIAVLCENNDILQVKKNIERVRVATKKQMEQKKET